MKTKMQVIGQNDNYGINHLGTVTMQNIAKQYGWESARFAIPESSIWPHRVIHLLRERNEELPGIHGPLGRFWISVEDGNKMARALEAAIEDMKAGKLDEEIFKIINTDGWNGKKINSFRERSIEAVKDFIEFCKAESPVRLIISTIWPHTIMGHGDMVLPS